MRNVSELRTGGWGEMTLQKCGKEAERAMKGKAERRDIKG
jgi:hypothetical protein